MKKLRSIVLFFILFLCLYFSVVISFSTNTLDVGAFEVDKVLMNSLAYVNIYPSNKLDSYNLLALEDEATSKVPSTTTTTTTNKITTTTKTTVTTTKKVTTTSKKDLVKKDGKVANTYVDAVNKQLNLLPREILDGFKKRGWNVYVTDRNLAKTYFDGVYGSVRAVTIYAAKVIYIEDRDVAVKSAPTHEFGHYLDFVTGWSSMTPEFEKIYEEEVSTFKKNIPNSSSVRDEQEFFASIFSYMYTDSKKCTPKAKAYVEKIVGDFIRES